MDTVNIFAIGDSHCIFYYDSLTIKNHWVGWGGMPVTMHRLIEEGLPLYDIANRLPPGDTYKLNIKDNDFVLFCYGWNDVQKNIYKYSKDNYELEIDRMVCKYINLIKSYSDGSLYQIKPIVNCVYPIPLSMNDTILGSDDERILYTKYMNKQLKARCLENNIPFFDIYDIITIDDKVNVNTADQDMTHLDRKNPELRSILEGKLIFICENYDTLKNIS